MFNEEDVEPMEALRGLYWCTGLTSFNVNFYQLLYSYIYLQWTKNASIEFET